MKRIVAAAVLLGMVITMISSASAQDERLDKGFIPLKDIIRFEMSRKEEGDSLIDFKEESLPEEIAAEDLVYDVISKDFFLRESTLQEAARENQKELSVICEDGAVITAKEDGNIIRDIQGNEDFIPWTELAKKVIHACIPVSMVMEYTAGLSVENLIKVDMKELPEGVSFRDLILDVVNICFYVNREKVEKQTTPEDTELSDGRENNMPVDHTWDGYSDQTTEISLENETEAEHVTESPTYTEPETEEIIPIHSHSYSPGILAEAQCLVDGTMLYSCGCGEYYTEIIPAVGHSWEDVSHGYAATYVTKFVCNTCRTQYDSAAEFGSYDEHGSYHVEDILVSVTDLGETDSADYWSYYGTRCIRCGAWQ